MSNTSSSINQLSDEEKLTRTDYNKNYL